MLGSMGHPAGVKLDRLKLARRRMRGARLLQQGVSEAQVARLVGVHRQSVNRWAQQLAKGGRGALKRAARTGRPPQLSAMGRKRIEQALKRGPEALGYRTGLWTARQHAGDLQQTCRGLGQIARRQRGRHRHARSASSSRPHPQMRAAELEDQVAGGTMSPKISRKAPTSTMEGPEKMQPRSSKRDFFELRGRKWASISKSRRLDLPEKRTEGYNI